MSAVLAVAVRGITATATAGHGLRLVRCRQHLRLRGGQSPADHGTSGGRGPYSAGQTIYFGTGKFFEDGDTAITAGAAGPVQSFYAVQGDNANNRDVISGCSLLLQQSI